MLLNKKKVTFFDYFLRSWFSFAKFRNIFLPNFAKFREIIHTKFRKINFYFRINFVFREIEKAPFVSTLLVTKSTCTSVGTASIDCQIHLVADVSIFEL
jgi:hypothetical protein